MLSGLAAQNKPLLAPVGIKPDFVKSYGFSCLHFLLEYTLLSNGRSKYVFTK